MRFLRKFFFLLLFASVTYGDNHLLINASLEDSEIEFDMDLSMFAKSLGESSYFFGVGTMGIGKEPSTGDAVYGLHSVKLFMQLQLTPFANVTAEIGGKVVFTQINGYDFLAFPAGVTLIYVLKLDRFHPVVRGSVYYGPAHLAVLDAKDYLEYRGGVGLQMDNMLEFFEEGLRMELSNFQIFFEYRSIITNYNNLDVVLNETFYGGVKLAF